MDPDDWLDGEMLRDNYELLIRYSPDFLIFGWFDHAFGRSVPKVFEDDVIESKKEFLEKFPTLFKKDVLYNVWNKLYKRSFLIENKLEFGHEKNGQDYLFNIRVYNKTNSVVINSRRYYHYIVKRPSSATANFHYQIFNLYKKEQIELINLMYKNDIHAPDIVSNRWYFILNNCWLRSRTRDKVLLKKRNKYIQDIIEEYKKYNYIDIKNLSNFKSRIKYLFFFRMGLFKYDFRNLH
ncbi:hypothetical protein X286_08955 [Oenococcus oeni IOEB_9517]|nr:hypothetical protein X286_08955 [Oenococcus oeni IOEB_9517]KGI03482.1 hypothetical protein X298_02870 [Oenococcus oeni IOEB_L65_2]